MKKLKRISALLGVFILIAMYLCTLIFALIDSPVASDLLKASIAATIFVPVILYGLLLVTRLLFQLMFVEIYTFRHGQVYRISPFFPILRNSFMFGSLIAKLNAFPHIVPRIIYRFSVSLLAMMSHFDRLT